MNNLIFRLAGSPFLRKQMKIVDDHSSAYRNMDDAEFVLRFLALAQQGRNFGGSLVRALDEFMAEHQNDTPSEISRTAARFTRALDWCERIWGDVAFKRPESNGWRDQFLAGMYDAQMLGVSELTEPVLHVAANASKSVILKTRALFSDPEFEQAVRTGTNTPKRIAYRTEKISEMLESV